MVLSWSSIAGWKNHVTPTEELARRLEELAEAGGLRSNLRTAGVSRVELPELAAEAAEQWTGTFNPRPLISKERLRSTNARIEDV